MISYETLLAILNSQLCWWFLVHTGTVLANGYYRFKPAYLKPLPLPEITSDMDTMMQEKVKIAINNTNNNDIIQEIDQLIYNWYNLEDDDIAEIQST